VREQARRFDAARAPLRALMLTLRAMRADAFAQPQRTPVHTLSRFAASPALPLFHIFRLMPPFSDKDFAAILLFCRAASAVMRVTRHAMMLRAHSDALKPRDKRYDPFMLMRCARAMRQRRRVMLKIMPRLPRVRATLISPVTAIFATDSLLPPCRHC